MIKRIARWLPDIPDAVIPDDDRPASPSHQIGTTDDAAARQMQEDVSQGTDAIYGRGVVLADEPLGPPRPVDPNAGSVRIGPLHISARFSLVLIFWTVVIFNVLLIIGVILVALIKSGRL